MTSAVQFKKALVRPPGANFAEGLTTANRGAPDLPKAWRQHDAYCAALEKCGVEVIRLPAEARHADSTFVEDLAIVTARGAILTRPGAPSRRGEVEAMREALEKYFMSGTRQAAPLQLPEIRAPGTLDGGDVCEADGHFFIGVSARTNVAGAEQLAAWLRSLNYSATLADIRNESGLLHLKSGLAWLGGKKLAAVEALARRPEFRGYEILRVPADEEYAANCVLVNGTLLIAEGFPKTAEALTKLGLKTLALDRSEFRKMDSGLSCLSLRWAEG